MLCVPRSWAASPCVIARQTEILSAIFAVSTKCSPNSSPSIFVFTCPTGPRYSTGARGLGSQDSWCAIPPGRKMWMTASAVALGFSSLSTPAPAVPPSAWCERMPM